MVIIKYESEDEVQAITAQQTAKGLHLVAVSNVTEGNFLGFDDRDVIQSTTPTSETTTLESQITELNDNQLSIMSAIADLYEAIATV